MVMRIAILFICSWRLLMASDQYTREIVVVDRKPGGLVVLPSGMGPIVVFNYVVPCGAVRGPNRKAYDCVYEYVRCTEDWCPLERRVLTHGGARDLCGGRHQSGRSTVPAFSAELLDGGRRLLIVAEGGPPPTSLISSAVYELTPAGAVWEGFTHIPDLPLKDYYDFTRMPQAVLVSDGRVSLVGASDSGKAWLSEGRLDQAKWDLEYGICEECWYLRAEAIPGGIAVFPAMRNFSVRDRLVWGIDSVKVRRNGSREWMTKSMDPAIEGVVGFDVYYSSNSIYVVLSDVQGRLWLRKIGTEDFSWSKESLCIGEGTYSHPTIARVGPKGNVEVLYLRGGTDGKVAIIEETVSWPIPRGGK